MAECSPQRFLAGNRNAIRTAALTPSTVLPIENAVLARPTSRNGSAGVALTGPYTGAEPATYDVQVTDDTVATRLISARKFQGAGSGTLDDISANGPAQIITVELSESGLPLLAAAIDFEGVVVKARTAGAAGNSIYFDVDQSGLTFTAQSFSLLNDLAAGAGGPDAGLKGAEFDYDTKIMGADGTIPADAHRIAFGTDTSAIYLQYKVYKDGDWSYHFVPALKRAVPAGTVVKFVTGGRTVRVYPGSPPETYNGIVTLYDLLDALRTESVLVDVDGVVANDRSPTGQAAHELQTRTDAYYLPSSGTGSANAVGFEDVTVDPDAGTQLVVATCRAVTAADHPLAGVTKTRWELVSSTLGNLGTIIEGELFEGDEFALRVPVRAPFEFGTQKGRFAVARIDRVSRADGEENEPPICIEEMTLGANATDQTITLEWTKAPSGSCACKDMPVTPLDPECLGLITEGGADMAYSPDARTRLNALYDWAKTVVDNCTQYIGGKAFDGIPEQAIGLPESTVTGSHTPQGDGALVATTTSTGATPAQWPHDAVLVDATFADFAVPSNFQECLDFYETGIKEIDAVTDAGDKTAGFTEWDVALQSFIDDLGASPTMDRLASIAIGKYKILVKRAMAYAGVPQLGKSDASTVVSGDGCWQFHAGDYWSVVSDKSGSLAPAYNGVPYISSSRASEKAAYFSTKEFGLQINIACVYKLKYGDTITLTIGGAGWPAMYQIGDQEILAIIGPQNLFLAGGQDASLVQRWYVNGSVQGPFPTFAYDPDAPASYTTGSPSDLSFTLNPGGIDFEKGDRFTFAIEGGHYRWRKDSGAWSSPAPIPDTAVVFDAGLFIEFFPGATPSFVAADTFSFRALQPWAVSNLQTPTVERWAWDAESPGPTIVANLGAPTSMDMMAIAAHTIPAGASIIIEGGTTPGVYDWLEAVTWRAGVIAHLFSETRMPTYLRLSLIEANGGGIGWWWAGTAFATSLSADTTPRRGYKLERGSGGLYQGGRFLGKAVSADVEWTDAALTETDVDGIVALADWVKEADDEPFVFLPQVTRLSDAWFVQLATDDVELSDLFGYQPRAGKQRRLSARLPLAGVWQ